MDHGSAQRPAGFEPRGVSPSTKVLMSRVARR